MVAVNTQGVPPPPDTTKSAAPARDDSPAESTPSLLSRKAGVHATGIVIVTLEPTSIRVPAVKTKV